MISRLALFLGGGSVNHRDYINIPDISQVVAFLTFPLKYFNSYYSLEQILIQPFINPIYSLEIYPLIIISSSDMYYSLPAIERSCMNCPLVLCPGSYSY